VHAGSDDRQPPCEAFYFTFLLSNHFCTRLSETFQQILTALSPYLRKLNNIDKNCDELSLSVSQRGINSEEDLLMSSMLQLSHSFLNSGVLLLRFLFA